MSIQCQESLSLDTGTDKSVSMHAWPTLFFLLKEINSPVWNERLYTYIVERMCGLDLHKALFNSEGIAFFSQGEETVT